MTQYAKWLVHWDACSFRYVQQLPCALLQFLLRKNRELHVSQDNYCSGSIALDPIGLATQSVKLKHAC